MQLPFIARHRSRALPTQPQPSRPVNKTSVVPSEPATVSRYEMAQRCKKSGFASLDPLDTVRVFYRY
jgi:hypothetical protein